MHARAFLLVGKPFLYCVHVHILSLAAKSI